MSETLSLKKPSKTEAVYENRFSKFIGKEVIVNTRSPTFLQGQLVDVGKQHIRLLDAREYILNHDGIHFFCEYSDVVIEKMQIGSCGISTEIAHLPRSPLDEMNVGI